MRIQLLTKEVLLGVVRRNTPPNYHEPLESTPNSGWEIHVGHAAQASRISQGMVDLERDLLIREAPLRSYATGSLHLTRLAPAEERTVLVRSEFRTTNGLRFLTTEDVTFQAGQAEVDVPARSWGVGYGYNVRPGHVVEIGVLQPGSTADPDDLSVTNLEAFAGSQPGALEALAWQRGITKWAGESADDFRRRILTPPHTVTPQAMERLASGYSAKYDALITVVEAHDNPFCLDSHFVDADDDYWVYSNVTDRGAFTVHIPDVGDVNDTAAFYDGSGDNEFFLDTECLDGSDYAKAAIGVGMLQTFDRNKAAGIAITVLQGGLNGFASRVTNYGIGN